MPTTPNIGLQVPIIGSNNWGGPLNYNFGQLDAFLSGNLAIPALNITGDLTVGGTITTTLGAILTAALFDVPNGIPQLNAGGLIPAALLTGQGITTVGFTATPAFDGSTGSQFKITLGGDVTSSTFINGLSGANLVTFRIVQDGTGGHGFVWPANVRGGGMPAPGAGTRNIQVFALDTDGSLDAAGPMMTT